MSTFELCETVRPLLSAVVDGEATPAEASLAEEHVRACRACASHLAFLRLSHGVLTRTPDAFPPGDLSARIAAATYARPTLSQRLFGFLRPAPTRYALATALTVGIVAVVVSRLPQPVTAPPGVADAPRPEAPAAPESGVTTSPSRADGAAAVPSVVSAPARPKATGPSLVAGSASRPVAAAPKSAVVPAETRPTTGSVANRAERPPAASGTVAAAPAPAPRRTPGVSPSSAIRTGEPKVTAPIAGVAPNAGSPAPLVADGAVTPRMSVPAPRSSPTPSLPDTGSTPTLAANAGSSAPATPSATPSAARTPVSEERRPTAVAHLDVEDEGALSLGGLKNVGPKSYSGEVAMNSLHRDSRGAGMNSSFGVADGRGAGKAIVDAPVK